MKNFETSDSLIFSCSGCSDAGYTAYKFGLALDNKGIVEMSCLAGVAAEKPSFLQKIKNKKIIVVDGCPIECAKGVFNRIKIPIHQHIQLRDYGVKKYQKDDQQEEQAAELMEKIKLI